MAQHHAEKVSDPKDSAHGRNLTRYGHGRHLRRDEADRAAPLSASFRCFEIKHHPREIRARDGAARTTGPINDGVDGDYGESGRNPVDDLRESLRKRRLPFQK
jgi:hypothetical protein